MKLQKKCLESILLALKETELNLVEARIRDKFMKSLGEVYQDFIGDRNKIYEHYCDKKGDGTPDTEDGNYRFKREKLEPLNKELLTLSVEDVELEAPESLKEMIEKTNYKPKTGEVELIDEVLALL